MSADAPQFLDGAEIELRRLLILPEARAARRHARTTALRAFNRSLVKPCARVVAAPEATSLLLQGLDHLSREFASRYATRFSPYQWLWYIRRCPHELFAGSVASTEPYALMLAQSLLCTPDTRAHAAISTAAGLTTRTYPIDAHTARALVEVSGWIAMIRKIQALIRWAGKGAAIEFNVLAGPREIASPDLVMAVHDYDRRLKEFIDPVHRLGTWLDHATERALDEPWVLGAYYARKYLRCPIRIGETTADAYGRFMPHPVSLRTLLDVTEMSDVEDPLAWHSELIALTCLLWLVRIYETKNRLTLSSILQRGYALVDDVVLRDGWEAFIAMCNYEKAWHPFAATSALSFREGDWLRTVLAIDGQAFPLIPGPLIGDAGGQLCWIDVFGATDRLAKRCQFPHRAGGLANLRGSHFESAVQKAIDDSPWKPSEQLAILRGRHLRIAGRKVGEIDAIGFRDGYALLVSCKSKIYTDEYDAGAHREVRNIATAVEQAVSESKALAAWLTLHPTGDNYDLTGLGELISVVITPSRLFVGASVATAKTSIGIPVYCSASEFVGWLREAENHRGA